MALVGVALVVAIPIAWVRRLISGRWMLWLLPATTASVAAALVAVVAVPLYALVLLSELRPALVPLATLTDGTRTVVFQGMLPIASEGFYRQVEAQTQKALSEGYTIFHEGAATAPSWTMV